MNTKFRLYSSSFGEYLERMPIGLIDKYISYLNSYASKGNYTYYFHVGWELTGRFGNGRVFVIEVYDGTSVEQIVKCLNKAYVNLFAIYHFDTEINKINLSISISTDYTWDKFNKTFLRVLKVNDGHFYPYTDAAVKFWCK